MTSLSKTLAEITLKIGAIRFNAREPFTWASGYRMPIYNDNRKLFSQAEYRQVVSKAFLEIIKSNKISPEVIAGVATSGIPHATTLADAMGLPLIYVRAQSKGHGLKNRIEGVLGADQRVLVVEDLISTGQSSLSAVTGVREAGGVVEECLAIFSYGFPEATEQFATASCKLFTILEFDFVIDVAASGGYIPKDQLELIRSWREQPFSWGENNGFPRVEK